MSSQRKGNAVKTPNQRAQYIDNVASPQESQGSTYEEALVTFDTTTSSPKDVPKKESTYIPSGVEPESPIGRFFREKWPEVLIGIFLLAILLQMYALNREVGELKVKLEQKEIVIDRVNKDAEKMEERLQKEIDRLNQKIDQNSSLNKQGK